MGCEGSLVIIAGLNRAPPPGNCEFSWNRDVKEGRVERWGAPGRAGVLEDAVEGRIIELELRRLEEEEGPGTSDGGTSRAAGEGGAVVGLC